MAYDRYGGDHPRQSVFAGTTNRMDFLPLDRSGNRRFLPVTVDASKADCHILDNPAESRHYFEQLWAEIMVQYKSVAYSTHLSKADEDALRKQQRILPMLRILNRQNLLPPLYHTAFSVQKMPTRVQ